MQQRPPRLERLAGDDLLARPNDRDRRTGTGQTAAQLRNHRDLVSALNRVRMRCVPVGRNSHRRCVCE